MKNLFNKLSNSSDFFREKRNVYQRKTPKIPTSAEAGRDYLLGEIDKEAIARKAKENDPLAGIIGPKINPIKVTKEQVEAAQKRGAKLRKRFGQEAYLKSLSDHQATMERAKYIKVVRRIEKGKENEQISDAQYKRALNNLVNGIIDTGNPKFHLDKAGQNAAKMLSQNFNRKFTAAERAQLVAAYHMFSEERYAAIRKAKKAGRSMEGYKDPQAGSREAIQHYVIKTLFNRADENKPADKQFLAYINTHKVLRDYVKGKGRKRMPTYKEALARLPKKKPMTKAQKLALARKRAAAARAEAKRVKATKARIAKMDVNKLIDEATPKAKPPVKYAGRKGRRRPR